MGPLLMVSLLAEGVGRAAEIMLPLLQNGAGFVGIIATALECLALRYCCCCGGVCGVGEVGGNYVVDTSAQYAAAGGRNFELAGHCAVSIGASAAGGRRWRILPTGKN
jgi:hypothetical protein